MKLIKYIQKQSSIKTEIVFLTILFFVATLYFFGSSGSNDVFVRQHLWVDNMQILGWKLGYELSRVDYPPLGLIILYYVAKVDKYTILTYGQSWHLMILGGMVGSLIAYYKMTRSYLLGLFALFVFLIVSIDFGYTDIVFLPFFIFSLFFLMKKKYFLSGLAFFLSVSIKWQPLILLPVFVIYLLNINKISFKIRKKNILSFLSFMAALVLIYVPQHLIFGKEVIISLLRATGWNTLTGNALNLGWILYYLNNSFFKLPLMYLINSLLWIFYLFYFILLLKFIYTKKTFYNFLYCLFVAALGYFVLNKGVHENHLFLAVSILPLIYNMMKNNIVQMIYWTAALNINIFVFYGFYGAGWPFPPQFGLDFALIFSILNFLMFIYLMVKFKLFKLVR